MKKSIESGRPKINWSDRIRILIPDINLTFWLLPTINPISYSSGWWKIWMLWRDASTDLLLSQKRLIFLLSRITNNMKILSCVRLKILPKLGVKFGQSLKVKLYSNIVLLRKDLREGNPTNNIRLAFAERWCLYYVIFFKITIYFYSFLFS